MGRDLSLCQLVHSHVEGSIGNDLQASSYVVFVTTRPSIQPILLFRGLIHFVKARLMPPGIVSTFLPKIP